MSPDQLEPRTEESVLKVLAGVPLQQAAAHDGVDPADLADAVEAYRAAGRTALEVQAASRSWHQVRIHFPDWDTAERTAAESLATALQRSEAAGTLAAWWFIRKAPRWRLRLQPTPTVTVTEVEAAIRPALDELAARGRIDGWAPAIYEPEAFSFGGPAGMDIAHHLFHADSRSILNALHPDRPAPALDNEIGRRELSILLCSKLFRGAGQDWYEQGDIWYRVAQMRPLPTDAPINGLRALTADVGRLMTVDTNPASPLFTSDQPLSSVASWLAAFDEAGRRIRAAADDGALARGVRAILAHHVIFHWNRLGLPGRTQRILARAARDSVLNPELPPAGR